MTTTDNEPLWIPLGEAMEFGQLKPGTLFQLDQQQPGKSWHTVTPECLEEWVEEEDYDPEQLRDIWQQAYPPVYSIADKELMVYVQGQKRPTPEVDIYLMVLHPEHGHMIALVYGPGLLVRILSP